MSFFPSFKPQPSNIYTINVKFPRTKSPHPLPEIRTIESVLEGHKEGVSPSSLPTILLTASYDSFSLVPSLASAQTDGAASTVALLEILRMFRRLYDDQKTAGRYVARALFPPATTFSSCSAAARTWTSKASASG